MTLKLMIVDDSNIIRSKITRTLTQHNMEVVTIEDLVAYRREHERKAS